MYHCGYSKKEVVITFEEKSYSGLELIDFLNALFAFPDRDKIRGIIVGDFEPAGEEDTITVVREALGKLLISYIPYDDISEAYNDCENGCPEISYDKREGILKISVQSDIEYQ